MTVRREDRCSCQDILYVMYDIQGPEARRQEGCGCQGYRANDVVAWLCAGHETTLLNHNSAWFDTASKPPVSRLCEMTAYGYAALLL